MARPELDEILNLDEPTIKRKLMTSVGALGGLYEVKMRPKRDTRSTRANAYYFAAVVKPFFEFLRDQEPTITEPIQAHTELKRQILGTMVINIGSTQARVVKTTHKMDMNQFWDYVERARAWLATQVGVTTLDPGEFGIDTSPVSKEAAAV